MTKVKIFVLVGVLLIVVVFLFFYLALPGKNADVKYEVIEVSSRNIRSTIFIKKKVWGMTSDNQVVVISDSNKKEFIPDGTQDYVYEGVMPLFYKLQEDTLFIYTLKVSTVPKNFKTGIKIIQTQLENAEMMKLIEHDNYKVQGLIAIK